MSDAQFIIGYVNLWASKYVGDVLKTFIMWAPFQSGIYAWHYSIHVGIQENGIK